MQNNQEFTTTTSDTIIYCGIPIQVTYRDESEEIPILHSRWRYTDPSKKKIYILRHEQRPKGAISFNVRLTAEGVKRAYTTVCSCLERRNIDVIYCSPFVRTLETIKPFSEKYGLKVNLEWSLVESIPLNPIIPSEFNNIINSEYKSFLPYETPETNRLIKFDELKELVNKFINSLDRSKNILLVTHLPVINAILSYQGHESVEMYTYHQPGKLLSMSGDAS